MEAIPRFDNQRSYMQIPFQYSLHVEKENNKLKHFEFLFDENINPRRKLAENMIVVIPKTGSIVAYNKGFEQTRIKELAGLFKDLQDDLMSIRNRFIDLIIPFRRLGYYHYRFNGSFSIKSVLPAMFPNDKELSYDNLEIHNGGMVMDTFANLHKLKDKIKLREIRGNLLKYCKLDIYAMVRIVWKLKEIVDK